MDLTITIVSWNTKELLRACLRSIYELPHQTSIEVHVVDNNSSDDSVEMVRQEFPKVLLFENKDNVGFARANNQSWRQSNGRYWLLLNSDAELYPGALDALVEFMDQHPRAGLASARLLNADGTPQHCAQSIPSVWLTLLEATRLHKLLPAPKRGHLLQGPYWTYDEAMQVGWTWGTALIARREAVTQSGPLDEDFWMYGEDFEWCLRMKKHGWQIWFCPTAEVLHHGGQSSAQQWDDAGRTRTIMDGSYRAISLYKSPQTVKAIQAAALLAAFLEIASAKLQRRRAPGAVSSLNYHKKAIFRR